MRERKFRGVEKDNTGFSNLSNRTNTRMIDQNGHIRVQKAGQSFFDKYSLYRILIVTSWTRFFLFILSTYLIFNFIFACIYFFIGVEHLGGANFSNDKEAFLEAYFFSAQTFTTVGYGRINPIGFEVNIVASLEAFMGVLIIAMFTGLLYGRFSRPNLRIIKSDKAVITDTNALMFRIANAKSSILTDAEIEIRVSMLKEENGVLRRRYYEIKTTISKISFMTLSWTIVHNIDEESPFFGMTKEDFEQSDLELIVLLRAFEDTFSQTVHSWLSYSYDDIVWNARFKSIIIYEDGEVGVDLNNINNIEYL